MKLSVIMPVFNGETFIVGNTNKVKELLTSFVDEGLIDDYEIIVVDDGSRDNTFRVLRENFSSSDKVVIIRNGFNQGKGFALKNGFFNSTGDVVVLLDSDLDIPPEQIENLIYEYKKGYDVVITSKFEKGSQIKYPIFRRIVSFGFYVFIKLLFGLPFKDTQTGLKLFRREVLEVCLSRMVVKRFAFDLELLLIAYRYNFSIKSIPVRINYHSSGFINPRILIMSFIDTIAIYYRLKILQFYDRPVFISKDKVYNFYFVKNDKTLKGINCEDKDVNSLGEEDYIILKTYEINPKLDLGVLSSFISSYRVEIINGSYVVFWKNFREYIISSILCSHMLQPMFSIRYRVITPKVLNIPLSNFLCVSSRVFRYLINTNVDVFNEEEVIYAISKKYHSVLFVSDWSCVEGFGNKKLLSEFFSKIKILIDTGNIGGLFGIGSLFFVLWFLVILGVVYNNLFLVIPWGVFFSMYLIFKLVVSGMRFVISFPVYLFFSFIVGCVGVLSPLLASLKKSKV